MEGPSSARGPPPPLIQDPEYDDSGFKRNKTEMMDPRRNKLIPLLKEKERRRRDELESQLSTDGESLELIMDYV